MEGSQLAASINPLNDSVSEGLEIGRWYFFSRFRYPAVRSLNKFRSTSRSNEGRHAIGILIYPMSLAWLRSRIMVPISRTIV